MTQEVEVGGIGGCGLRITLWRLWLSMSCGSVPGLRARENSKCRGAESMPDDWSKDFGVFFRRPCITC